MAGRPVNEEYRDARKREVDVAVELIKRRGETANRKTIALELGITVQSLYGGGFLSCYIKELEESGIITVERAAVSISATEAKKLTKAAERLQKENKRLKAQLSAQQELVSNREEEIDALKKQLEIEHGKSFLKAKREFAQSRV